MSALRTRKFARTRLTLARALAQALAAQSLSEVPVKALCQQAEVSEATFFNYFPRKQDLMTYLAHLWLLELSWHAQSAAAASQGLAVIDRLFAETAKTCEATPGLFRELLVWMVRGGNLEQSMELSAVEKQLAFPQLAGIEQTPIKGIDRWLAAHLESAIAHGDLPANSLVLGGGAPVYEREFREPAYFKEYQKFRLEDVPEPEDCKEVSCQLVRHPNIASKRWVAEQYDTMVRTNNMTTNSPADAGLVNIKGTRTALALTTDCNARYVHADPRKGAMIAVSEAARNIVCSGGEPVAITNCLNFDRSCCRFKTPEENGHSGIRLLAVIIGSCIGMTISAKFATRLALL